MLEATLAAFAAGAVVGASARALISTAGGALPPAPPPPPPPMPQGRRPRTRIFYKMKELPLTPEGEDTRGRSAEQEGTDVFVPLAPRAGARPRITDQVISAVVLKKAPPPMSIEEKRAAFFAPQMPIHIELLQRLHTLHPQM